MSAKLDKTDLDKVTTVTISSYNLTGKNFLMQNLFPRLNPSSAYDAKDDQVVMASTIWFS